MDKYHTLFLADNGSVYSCGFGVGGRLGHDNEEPVLVRLAVLSIHSSRSILSGSQTNHGIRIDERNGTRSLH